MSNTAITCFIQLCQHLHLQIDTPPILDGSDDDTTRIQSYLNTLNQAIDSQVVAYGIDAVHHIEEFRLTPI